MKKVILLVMFLPLQAFSQIVIKSSLPNKPQAPVEELITSNGALCGDVIISEIMPDPDPPVSLPQREYIEIHNRSGSYIGLEKWHMCSGDNCITFPRVEIKPGEYLILCSQTDTIKFRDYGRVIGFKSFPSLPGERGVVFINDDQGKFIHGIEYTSDWYNDRLKEDGGWSLEIIDTDYPFYTVYNWKASDSGTGGTPGRRNSVSGTNPDQTFYGIENVFPSDSLTVEILFSESLPFLAEKQGSVSIGGMEIADISVTDPLYRCFDIRLTEPLENGTIYSFVVSGDLSDFAGNQVKKGSFRFGLPENSDRKDVVFNELLFNPLPDSYDYFELANISKKTIDASSLFTASINPETGDTAGIKPISHERRCILPGSLYAVTTNPEIIASQYISSDIEHIHRASSMSSMPDDKGHLLLLSRKTDVLDEVVYSEKMHYSLISDNEGISLEKIRPEMPSEESRSWHSASESSGWGTPGTVNSIWGPASVFDNQIILSSRRISPDNDGNEDILLIDFNFGGPGNVVSASIFNETGSLIVKLAENYLTGAEATLVWDGIDENGSLVQTGIYIVLINIYNDKGKSRSLKKACTVIR